MSQACGSAAPAGPARPAKHSTEAIQKRYSESNRIVNDVGTHRIFRDEAATCETHRDVKRFGQPERSPAGRPSAPAEPFCLTIAEGKSSILRHDKRKKHNQAGGENAAYHLCGSDG